MGALQTLSTQRICGRLLEVSGRKLDTEAEANDTNSIARSEQRLLFRFVPVLATGPTAGSCGCKIGFVAGLYASGTGSVRSLATASRQCGYTAAGCGLGGAWRRCRLRPGGEPNRRRVGLMSPRRRSVGVQSLRLQFVDPSQSLAALQDSWHTVTFALASASLLLVDAADGSTSAAAAATAAAGAQKAGLWNGFVHLIETIITGTGDTLAALGVPGSYGFAIIFLTIIVKAITFPLNYKQMKSTMAMQALAPKVRELQARYRDNPQLLNLETARLYQEAKVNPLTGCLPVFVQLPVWIALYRALMNLAADNRLDQGFFWLPSLEGPVRQGQGLSSWLFPFQNGAPPIGWHDAIAYLVLPCLLVVSQSISQKILQPPVQDPQQQQANAILRFLPFMVGWFSLNVPSGLGLYWVTNNIVSTIQTIGIKRYLASKQPERVGAPRTLDGAVDERLNPEAMGFTPRTSETNGDAVDTEDPSTKSKRKPSKKKRR